MKAEKEKLIIDNIGLAYKMARVLRYHSIPMEDRISIAMMGLVEAALAYDESKEVRFTTFACTAIRFKMINELKRVLKHKDVTSLDKPFVNADGEEMSLIDVLPDTESGYEEVELSDLTGKVEQLPADQKKVIRFVFDQGLSTQKAANLMKRRRSWLEDQLTTGVETLKLMYMGGV